MSVVPQLRDPRRVRPESCPIFDIFLFGSLGHIETGFPLDRLDSVSVTVEVELPVALG